MSRLSLWKFNEASSGTAPTTVADSDASPLNLTITYGGGNWTTISGYGSAFAIPNTAGNGARATQAVSSKYTSVFDGTLKTASAVVAINHNAGGTQNYGRFGLDSAGPNCFVWELSPASQWGLSADLSGSGSQDWALLNAPSSGYHVYIPVIDTPNATASQRARVYLDGFLAADATSGTGGTVTQNSVLVAATQVDCGAPNYDPVTYYFRAVDVGSYSLYGSALTSSDALRLSLRLFASGASDTDPDVSGANLLAASTNGGTNDVSSSTADHTISFTVTIGASGLNRKVVIPIAYMGVTSGITSITFNGSATGVHLSAQQQSNLATLAGCDVYEILDADLPAAGVYTISATVDGAAGVACGSPIYVTGVAQSYANNVGLATGTGTGITATLAGSASAGSILVGQMLDVSFGDAPISAVNQLRLATQATSSVIEQTVDAKYVTNAGSDSMSWSGLTNASGKIAVAIEIPVFTVVGLASNGGCMAPNARIGSGFRLAC